MIHALTLLVVILFAAPLVKNVPQAALVGILFMVTYNMGDWAEIPEILQKSGRAMLVCGARPQSATLMHEAGFDRHVGAENICPSISEALKRAEELQRERSE